MLSEELKEALDKQGLYVRYDKDNTPFCSIQTNFDHFYMDPTIEQLNGLDGTSDETFMSSFEEIINTYNPAHEFLKEYMEHHFHEIDFAYWNFTSSRFHQYEQIEFELSKIFNSCLDGLPDREKSKFVPYLLDSTNMGNYFYSVYSSIFNQLKKEDNIQTQNVFRSVVSKIPENYIYNYLSDEQKKEIYYQKHLEDTRKILRNAGYLDVSEWVYDFSEDEKKFFNSLPAIDKENFIKEVIEEFDAGRMQSSFYLSDSDVINEINPITEKILNEYKAKQALNNSKKEVKRESLKDRTVHAKKISSKDNKTVLDKKIEKER